jgi:hypothetical protein
MDFQLAVYEALCSAYIRGIFTIAFLNVFGVLLLIAVDSFLRHIVSFLRPEPYSN